MEELDGVLNVNCVDYMGRNVLYFVIDSEKIGVIEILIDNLNFNCIEEVLLYVISKGVMKIVKLIIEYLNFMVGEDRFKSFGVIEVFFRIEEKS